MKNIFIQEKSILWLTFNPAPVIYSGLLYWAGMAIESAERTIQDSLDQFHNPKHSSTTCTAGTKTLVFMQLVKTQLFVRKNGNHKSYMSKKRNYNEIHGMHFILLCFLLNRATNKENYDLKKII